MGISTIPVDILNSGQVFACIGFVETATALWGHSTGGFKWGNHGTSFRFSVDSVENPALEVLKFLAEAEVIAVTPTQPEHLDKKWLKALDGLELKESEPIGSYPIPVPSSAATVPVILQRGEQQVQICYWGDDRLRVGRDNVKFWAGAGGYPGGKLIRDALDMLPSDPVPIAEDPLNYAAEQSSSCRFDWRRDYIPLDIGFSLNAHSGSRFSTSGFPVVEVLASIGVSHARPVRVDTRDKLRYRYGVLGHESNRLYPIQLLRVSLGCPTEFPFPLRIFQMNLGWPGKEGQARCITTVTEEQIQ